MSTVAGFLKTQLGAYPRLRRVARAARQVVHDYAPSDLERARIGNLRRIREIEREVRRRERRSSRAGTRPVVFFVATQHTNFFGLSAAIGLLGSWALRLAGHPVLYYVCYRGLSQCVLGSNRHGVISNPPCRPCTALRDEIYPADRTIRFTAEPDRMQTFRNELRSLDWEELTRYVADGVEYGRLCLPSLRWVERRQTLESNPFREYMLREYIASARNLASDLSSVLGTLDPASLVLFNGTHFPEATARVMTAGTPTRAVTYETGLTGISAYFTHGVATEYPIRVPPDFVMGPTEDQRLDSYLAERRRGRFTIAGRRQWSDIAELPAELAHALKHYAQSVAIFGNVIWDTSQAYADAFFPSMFAWLESTLREAESRPNTLFVVRAHPDEGRRAKPSRESVSEWLSQSRFARLPNVFFIPPDAHASSYSLMQAAKFCVVYNSTVGLEAAAAGKYVLPGGRARYRDANVCYHVTSVTDYGGKLTELLDAGRVDVPSEWRLNARRFFYFSLFRASLDLSRFLRALNDPEFTLTDFPAAELDPANCPETRAIVDGITAGRDFYLA